MTDSTQTRHQGGHGGSGGACDDCDPDLLDALKCRAKGLQARADYNTAHLQALVTAREQYEGARAAYSAARAAATPLVEQAKSDLKCLLERLECLLDEDEDKRRAIVKKIRKAFWEVHERIEECGSKTGCYLDDDCDFDDVRDCEPYDVPARLADIQQRTAAAEACFADLITIPTVLPTTVAALQAEITAISDGANGDPSPEVLVELYAAALVARQHAHDIWRGFDDVNDFVDCVCHALTCMLRGHTAIAILVGMLAVAQCQRESREAACELLRTKTAEQVVAAYLRHERGDRPAVAEGKQAAASGGGRPDEDQSATDRQAARERAEREYFAG
jgi:enamine deaminase RidA (YjgF/YER057c/UK114 family)